MAFYNYNSPIFPNTQVLEDQINQLAEVSAIASFIQTENAIPRWATSDPPGIGSDHNLLLNSDVYLDENNHITNVRSIGFTGSVGPDGLYDNGGTLYYNGSPVGGDGNVVSTSTPVAGNALPRFDGISGLFIEESQVISGPVNTQFYGAGGPQISLEGIALPNPALALNSSVLGHYSSSFIVTPYTGPYITPPGNLLLLIERIGDVVNITLASALNDVADAAAPAAIVMTTPVPIGYRPPTSTKTGLLAVIDNNVSQVGCWEMNTAGILTIRPSPDLTSQFAAPVAGTSGTIGQSTITYTVR